MKISLSTLFFWVGVASLFSFTLNKFLKSHSSDLLRNVGVLAGKIDAYSKTIEYEPRVHGVSWGRKKAELEFVYMTNMAPGENESRAFFNIVKDYCISVHGDCCVEKEGLEDLELSYFSGRVHGTCNVKLRYRKSDTSPNEFDGSNRVFGAGESRLFVVSINVEILESK